MVKKARPFAVAGDNADRGPAQRGPGRKSFKPILKKNAGKSMK
jgi:hypothetical protein